MPTITETLKTKLDEFEIERRLDELTVATEKAVKRAIEHAGELAHDNRDRVAHLLDKAGTAIDQRTEGKYHDTVGKVAPQVVSGVDKLATKRPGADHDSFDSAAAPEGAKGSGDPGAAESRSAETPQDASAPEAAQHSSAATPQDARAPWTQHTDEV